MTKRLERKISVDVSDMSEEQKKRVQDCFFKLGYEWLYSGGKYRHLNVEEYTNTRSGGKLDDNLMYGEYCNFSVPPITLEELERITAEFTGEGLMQEQQFEVGGVYKCGEGYVRIIADLSGDDKHPNGFYELVGISCDMDGRSDSCAMGMFTNENNEYYTLNNSLLQYKLEPLEPATLELTLQQVADKLGIDVKQLRIKD